jgi:RNA-directed DNA polymerase
MIFTISKLIRAYLSCRRRKRKTVNALMFEQGLEKNFLQLKKELENRLYRPSRSLCFVVTYPKIREIFAADFSDRIIHHLLVNEIGPYFEKSFIYNSFACRKGKGTHTALKKLQQSLNEITRNQAKKAFYIKLDIKSFFTCIDKKILYRIISAEIAKIKTGQNWKEEIYYLLRTIIFHNPTKNYVIKGERALLRDVPYQKSLFNAPCGKGLPIGNLTSQFFANVYLNELDQFIKRRLKVKYYFRYVDDLILLSESSDQLWRWREKIDFFLKEILRLELHPDKDKYGPVYRGIDFIGYIVRPGYILSRKRIVKNLKTKLHYFNKGLILVSGNQKQEAFPLSTPPTKGEIKQMASVINSYYSHFKHANCYNLRKNLYENHFGELKKYLKPEKDLSFFRPFKPAR